MHVLQWIAVKAENDDEAMQIVEAKLQDEMGPQDKYLSWYDWFVMGGGRFNENANPYESSKNMIVPSTDKDKFMNTITEALQSRVDEFNLYRKSYDEKNVDLDTKLDSYTGEMNFDFELYPLGKMIDMIQGKWDYNSYFFDIENDSTNATYVIKDLDFAPEKWYLVPVDFHF